MEGPNSLVSLIHSEPGIGKSRLIDSAPSPRLIIDTEGKSKYFRGQKTYWDPKIETPPEADRVIVLLTQYETFEHVFGHLQVSNPFASCGIDSMWNAQKILIRELYGVDAPRRQDWGEIKRKLEALVANYMLLNFQVLTLSCGSIYKDDKIRPMLDGAITQSLAHLVDVIGYLYVEKDPQTGELVRMLQPQPVPEILAKDNTGAFPDVIENPNLSEMLLTYNKYISEGDN